MANYNYTPAFLSPLKKQRVLKNISTFDIETEEWKDDTYGMSPEVVKEDWHNKPIPEFLAVWYNTLTNDTHYYDGPLLLRKFLIDYLKEENCPLITYAHNGGKFDFLKLFELIRGDGRFKKFVPEVHYAHGKVIEILVHDHDKHTWRFRDSIVLLNASLDELCSAFKPKHMKLERPKPPTDEKGAYTTTFAKHYRDNKEIYIDYCVNDCLSLAEILEKFNGIIRDIGGCIAPTIASTAMLTWRKRFLKMNLPTYHIWNEFIRTGYYGGRVEIFNMYAMEQGHPYYYYDCNSEFPSVMYDNVFPSSTPRRMHYKDAEDCIGKCGLMECEIVTPEDLNIPILPYRTREKRLLFPVGNWTGVYEFSLIEKALSYGYEIKPIRTIEFDGAPLFHEYVGTLFPLKQKAEDGAMRETIKFLLNALYGKFAERPLREEIITDPMESIHGALPLENIFGYCIKKTVRTSAYHLPAISARVTALAQLKLYEMFEKIQGLGGTVYYCDTDSVITDVILPTSSELGEWKKGVKAEDRHPYDIAEAVFLAPKAYCLKLYKTDQECKTVMKGFSKYMKRHLTIEDFRRALPPKNDLSPFVEYRVQPASFKEIATRSLDGFCTIMKPRSIKQIYNKREIDDTLGTKPLSVIDGDVQWKEPPSTVHYDDFEWGF